jgi:prevent-host-death family protein
MVNVGVRELRQQASALLRLVEAGETVQVTDRGRPVAVLAPLPDGGPLERLRSTGELTPAAGNLADLPAPLRLERGAELPSRTLERLRRNER